MERRRTEWYGLATVLAYCLPGDLERERFLVL